MNELCLPWHPFPSFSIVLVYCIILAFPNTLVHIGSTITVASPKVYISIENIVQPISSYCHSPKHYLANNNECSLVNKKRLDHSAWVSTTKAEYYPTPISTGHCISYTIHSSPSHVLPKYIVSPQHIYFIPLYSLFILSLSLKFISLHLSFQVFNLFLFLVYVLLKVFICKVLQKTPSQLMD